MWGWMLDIYCLENSNGSDTLEDNLTVFYKIIESSYDLAIILLGVHPGYMKIYGHTQNPLIAVLFIIAKSRSNLSFLPTGDWRNK